MPDNMGRIAVIEDDSIMGESLQRALELEGWSTSWWQTGKEAIDGMRACDPDLVLCDIRLPDMSGEEIFRAANSHCLGAALHLHDGLWADRSSRFARARRRP